MPRNALLVALGALALLWGCSDPPPAALVDRGYAELASGEHAAARSSFRKASEQLAATDAQHLRAALGSCRAGAHLDPSAAREDFTQLAQSNADRITSGDYRVMIDELVAAAAYEDAVRLADAAVQRFPESPEFRTLIASIEAKAKTAGDRGALSAIENLGYAGSGK